MIRRRPEYQQVGNKIWKTREVIQSSSCAIVNSLALLTCDTAITGITEDLSQKMKHPNALNQGFFFQMRALGKQLRDLSKRTLLHWSSSFLGRYFFPFFFSRLCTLLPALWVRPMVYSKKVYVQVPEQVWSLEMVTSAFSKFFTVNSTWAAKQVPWHT